ncbi:multiple banded antigen, partial [Ureaplasma parvum serovar 1 str. ATCC 27813]|uniref:multiple banded antigen n=1 Tax=Ureaplasma parvum TaxID=134821 RepID=UPI0001721F9D
MKLLKNKKFWAMTLGVTLVGAGIVAIAASCSNSTVKSKLSNQFAKSTDDKSFYAVYEIENFKDLSDNDKKSLNDIEFNAALTSVENKTENLVTKGHLVGEKIYVKLPREPKPNEQLTIINKSGLIKTSGLLIPDNLNYQTEKVNFENAPKPEPTPTPTPTTKEDKAVVSKIELVEPNKESKQTKVKLEFSEFSLKDETKKVLKLTLTSGSENKEVELELSADKKSATTKELVDFSTKTYKVSKLTLNDVEVNVDSVKNNDLKIAESTPTTKEDKAVVSKIELVEPNKESKQTKVKLEFSEFSLKDETKKVLKLTLTSGSENKEVELELSADKKSATTKELVDFSTKTYKVSKLTLNDVEVNVDSVKNNDLKIAESTPTTKEDKAVVSKIELVEPNKESKQTKVKLEF